MSNYKRLLQNSAMNIELWSEATAEMFEGEWSTREQADYYGVAFADAVLTGALTVDELKSMACEANQWERDSMKQADGDMENLADSADYIEATARRIAHQSLRSAFNMVKTRELFSTHREDYLYRDDIPRAEDKRTVGIHSLGVADSSGWLL